MTDIDRIEQRLAAVERTVTDGDRDLNDIADLTDLADDIEEVEERLDAIEDRVAELEGVHDALEGYVNNVRSVNENVEQQAGAAYAAVDRLESRVDDIERAVDADSVGHPPSGNADGDADGVGQPPSGNADGTTVQTDSPGSRRTDLEQTVDDIVPETEQPADDGGLMSSLTDGVFSDEESTDGNDEAATPTQSEPAPAANGDSPTGDESDDEDDGFLASLFK